MPELPEVETTRRGIAPHLEGHRIRKVVVRQPQLRWPVPAEVQQLKNARVLAVRRRAKFLLVDTDKGEVLLHLGMSGSLRFIAAAEPPGKHDHVDIVFGQSALRLTDPRRFGSLHWTRRSALQHRLISPLGCEPLSDEFNADYLYEHSRSRRVAVKQFIMNSHIVVGIGNIYASEALYMAGIHPGRAAGRISRKKYRLLAEVIKEVLTDAIEQGGTTLQDFVNGEGKPGYFSQYLNVYGKAGEPCISCRVPIREIRQGQRSTFYCPKCQK